MLRVLGIDPGSRVCGYGLIGVAPREDQAMERRLGEIARGLREVIEELAPEAMAVEAVFVHANIKSALALAQARGMVLAIAGLVGLPVFTYEPAVVKKTVVGSGRAGKGQVARMVAGMVGLRTLPRADAADALAVAITHARLCRPSSARLVAATVKPSATAVRP